VNCSACRVGISAVSARAMHRRGSTDCVSLSGRSLQIPAQQHRHHYVKATVRVHEYPDGQLAAFDGPHCLTAVGCGLVVLSRLVRS
jgi:hypothetical protein